MSKEIDPKIRMPLDNMFIFVTNEDAHLGTVKDNIFVSMTEKGAEYTKDQVKYWIEN